MIGLGGYGPPLPFVLPPGLEYDPGKLFWWAEQEIRYRRRIGYAYIPAQRWFEQLQDPRFTCTNLHPNIKEGEQCPYCGTETEYWFADFESDEHVSNWLTDSWRCAGPRFCRQLRSWDEVVETVLSCPDGTYAELISYTNAELRMRYGAREFPPENDDPTEELANAEKHRAWARQHAEWDRQEADELWAAYDQWEEEQRTKRLMRHPSSLKGAASGSARRRRLSPGSD